MLIPAAYTVFKVNPNEIVIAKDSLLNVTDPRLSVSVTSAGARTAEQVADDVVASMLGFELKRSTIDIAGQEALVLDNVPGQDLMRRVLFVHNGRLFDLTFSPADHEQMEAFYNSITANFQLLEAAQ
jgi:hypothetical protein